MKNFTKELKRQKEEAMALNQTWGRKKAGFYGRDKENDELSETSEDEEEQEQAEYLQEIKRRKMQRYMQNEHNKVTQSKLEDDLTGNAPD